MIHGPASQKARVQPTPSSHARTAGKPSGQDSPEPVRASGRQKGTDRRYPRIRGERPDPRGAQTLLNRERQPLSPHSSGTHPSPGTSRSLRPRARSCLARPPPPSEGFRAVPPVGCRDRRAFLGPPGRARAACLRDIPAGGSTHAQRDGTTERGFGMGRAPPLCSPALLSPVRAAARGHRGSGAEPSEPGLLFHPSRGTNAQSG